MNRNRAAHLGPGVSVFVADPHGMLRQGLMQMFGDDDRFTAVGQASNGPDALDGIRQLLPQVAILSLAMGSTDGTEVVSRALAEKLQTRFIVLGVLGEKYAAQRSFLAGAKGCVYKEATFEELASIALRVAAGESGIRHGGESRVGGQAPGHQDLSHREQEVLGLVGRGLTSKQIGEVLFISARTVDSHRLRIMQKLEIRNAPGLVKYAIEHGLFPW